MNWDHRVYGFGTPNAQPPTPIQTPTSSIFPTPLFQTPLPSKNGFDIQSGWTPTFAEDYSVFNATPGRLVSTHPSFVDTTPRPSTASSLGRPGRSTEDLAAEIATHVHHTLPATLVLPPVDPSRQLSSSPGIGQGRLGDNNLENSTLKPRKRLAEAFSAQTATPPHSAKRAARRLVPKASVPTMQQDEDVVDENLHLFDTPGQQNVLNFSAMGDGFSYSMSGPATAPAYTHSKPFWDPDTSMTGMGMDFAVGDGSFHDNSAFQSPLNAFNWAHETATLGGATNVMQSEAHMLRDTHDLRRTPSLAGQARAPPSFPIPSQSEYGSDVMDTHDPFLRSTALGSVNPGLIFGISDSATMLDPDQKSGSPTSQRSAPIQPYLHQNREYFRDQEDQLRLRTSRNKSTQPPRPSDLPQVTPTRVRPGIQRSVSDSRAKRPAAQKTAAPVSRPGRSSPLKQLSRPNLSAIPETGMSIASSVIFSIDESGRARADTTPVRGKSKSRRSSPRSVEHESSTPESSSDDEPIIVPSRHGSFNVPDKRHTGFGRVDDQLGLVDVGVRRGSYAVPTSSHGSVDGQSSDADTVVDYQLSSGDATAAIQRVVYDRKRSSSRAGTRSVSLHTITPQRSAYGAMGPPTISPLASSAFDMASPANRRAGSKPRITRCICGQREADAFMIQCESCEQWMHGRCVGITRNRMPQVYICAFCAQTPNMGSGQVRPAQSLVASSPLAHKASGRFR